LLDWDSSLKRFKCSWHSGDFNESLLRKIIKQLAAGLHQIHSQQIVHCDLKPSNILITDSLDVKIADFGQAVYLQGSEQITRTHGTYQFMSPESVICKSYSATSTFSGVTSDIWAFGVCLYACIYKVLPFDSSNIHGLLQTIEKSRYSLKSVKFPSKPKVSKQIKQILESLLDKNPATRVTLEELIRSPYLN
jgi:serine/threonine protein kinase